MYVLGIFKDMQPRDVDQLVDRLVWDQDITAGSMPVTLTTRVRNSVVEAHSDEMVVDGSNPSVPTNVAHKV